MVKLQRSHLGSVFGSVDRRNISSQPNLNNLNIKAEWFQKSYEYHLCQDTLELCNQEFARVMFDALSK